MRELFFEKMNNQKYRRLKDLHSLEDCLHEEMSDTEIALELNIAPEEARCWRENYEG